MRGLAERLRFGRARERRQGGMRVDGRAQVLDDQVPVDARRDTDVAVPHEPLNAVNVHSSAEQLGCESVPQVVEPHPKRDGFGPQHSATRRNEGIPAAHPSA